MKPPRLRSCLWLAPALFAVSLDLLAIAPEHSVTEGAVRLDGVGPDRNFTLANRNNAHSPNPPDAADSLDPYPGGWGLRREGNGTLPPTMIPDAQPPADPNHRRHLESESIFPTGNARFALPPTCDGYPDVDTYRDLEFYLEAEGAAR